MENRICLKKPGKDELRYRRHLITDPATMEFNRGYGDLENGCYVRTDEEVQSWYEKWNTQKDRFYAYIVLKESGLPVGETALYWESGIDKYMVSVIVEGRHRGKEYAKDALRELLKYAFDELQLSEVADEFPADRTGAEKTFAALGFQRQKEGYVLMTRENYYFPVIL